MKNQKMNVYLFQKSFEKKIAQKNMSKDNTHKKKVKQQEDKNRKKRTKF